MKGFETELLACLGCIAGALMLIVFMLAALVDAVRQISKAVRK